MSNYTEKTSGAQIKALLTEMYGEKVNWCDLKYDNGNVGVYRLPEMPSVMQLYLLLEQFEINPWFVTIDTVGGHLTMWFCNYDGSDIEIGDE